jgi:hypothetical protein
LFPGQSNRLLTRNARRNPHVNISVSEVWLPVDKYGELKAMRLELDLASDRKLLVVTGAGANENPLYVASCPSDMNDGQMLRLAKDQPFVRVRGHGRALGRPAPWFLVQVAYVLATSWSHKTDKIRLTEMKQQLPNARVFSVSEDRTPHHNHITCFDFSTVDAAADILEHLSKLTDVPPGSEVWVVLDYWWLQTNYYKERYGTVWLTGKSVDMDENAWSKSRPKQASQSVCSVLLNVV